MDLLGKPLPWVPAMPGSASYVLREAQKEIQRLNEEIERLTQEVERQRLENRAIQRGVQIKATAFFKRFVDEWARSANSRDTTPGIYYWKLTEAKKAGLDGLTASEWTPAMITFLDLLASKLGYVQLYERPIQGVRSWDRDCIWTIPPNKEPHVTIEAENLPESVFGSNGEVAKLLRDESGLKVLVTYHADGYADKGSGKAWQDDYLKRLRGEVVEAGHMIGRADDIGFLLVLGDEVTIDPHDWYGFLLTRTMGHWAEKWKELSKRES